MEANIEINVLGHGDVNIAEYLIRLKRFMSTECVIQICSRIRAVDSPYRNSIQLEVLMASSYITFALGCNDSSRSNEKVTNDMHSKFEFDKRSLKRCPREHSGVLSTLTCGCFSIAEGTGAGDIFCKIDT